MDLGWFCLSGVLSCYILWSLVWWWFIELQTWLIAPYKKPEHFQKENMIFNKHVSALRICSEHSIGMFKGRFPSLKNLCINISNPASHCFATFWILDSAVTHNFAIKCEAEERGLDEDWDVTQDPFLEEGLSTSSSEDENVVSGHSGEQILVTHLWNAREMSWST